MATGKVVYSPQTSWDLDPRKVGHISKVPLDLSPQLPWGVGAGLVSSSSVVCQQLCEWTRAKLDPHVMGHMYSVGAHIPSLGWPRIYFPTNLEVRLSNETFW